MPQIGRPPPTVKLQLSSSTTTGAIPDCTGTCLTRNKETSRAPAELHLQLSLKLESSIRHCSDGLIFGNAAHTLLPQSLHIPKTQESTQANMHDQARFERMVKALSWNYDH
jgi:hypothetical protein